jgi:DNA-binding GntR family transcriptional regulator
MQYVNAAESAYQRLRSEILSGEYEPGARLSEVEASAALGVSRTPVREALRRLGVDGLVELLPNRGARVATWTIKDIEEIYELRVWLESYGTTRAATQVDEDDLAHLENLCAEEEAAIASGDVPKIFELNVVYHRTLMKIANNRRLYDMVLPLIEVQTVLRTFRQYSREQRLRNSEEHRHLNQALSAREPRWAEAIMRAHLMDVQAHIIEDKRRSMNRFSRCEDVSASQVFNHR